MRAAPDLRRARQKVSTWPVLGALCPARTSSHTSCRTPGPSRDPQALAAALAVLATGVSPCRGCYRCDSADTPAAPPRRAGEPDPPSTAGRRDRRPRGDPGDTCADSGHRGARAGAGAERLAALRAIMRLSRATQRARLAPGSHPPSAQYLRTACQRTTVPASGGEPALEPARGGGPAPHADAGR
jgi:hypothetical protein